MHRNFLATIAQARMTNVSPRGPLFTRANRVRPSNVKPRGRLLLGGHRLHFVEMRHMTPFMVEALLP